MASHPSDEDQSLGTPVSPLHALLSRRGHEVNVKRVYKLYVEEQLMVRRKKRKRLVRERAVEPRLLRANQKWAMDLLSMVWPPAGLYAS